MRVSSLGAAAFATNISLASATTVAVIAAVNATSTVAMIALGGVATVFAGLTIGAATAFFDTKSTTVANYFEQVKHHSGYTIVALFQVVAHAMFQALVEGAAGRVKDKVSGRQGFNVN